MIEKDFDCYQRYTALRQLLDAVFSDTEQGVRVLDVGAGTSTLSAEFLGTRYRIVRCDVVPIDDPDSVLLTPGQPLPFADREFDAVIAMDVLEHVEPSGRQLFLSECVRVAREMCIIAAPEGSPELAAAEARVYAIHETYLGKHHFFEEHKEFGVPPSEEVMNVLSATGRLVWSFPNVPLAAWEAFSCLDFIAYSDPVTQQLTIPAHMAQNENVRPVAPDAAHYRRFYVACVSPSIGQRVSQYIDGLLRTNADHNGRSVFYPIWQFIAGLCRKNHALDAALYEHQRQISGLNTRLAEAAHEMAGVTGRLTQVQSELDAAKRELAATRDQLAAQGRTLHAILNSRTWRYTRVLRSAGALLRPRGK